MTTMLERAARAVSYTERRKGDAFDISDDMARDIARAVLMAVREPGMCLWVDADCTEDVHPLNAFTAMIDAILNEEQPK